MICTPVCWQSSNEIHGITTVTSHDQIWEITSNLIILNINSYFTSLVPIVDTLPQTGNIRALLNPSGTLPYIQIYAGFKEIEISNYMKHILNCIEKYTVWHENLTVIKFYGLSELLN